jgi:hypothetical protein
MIYVIASLMPGVKPVRAFKISKGEEIEVPLQVVATR